MVVVIVVMVVMVVMLVVEVVIWWNRAYELSMKGPYVGPLTAPTQITCLYALLYL